MRTAKISFHDSLSPSPANHLLPPLFSHSCSSHHKYLTQTRISSFVAPVLLLMDLLLVLSNVTSTDILVSLVALCWCSYLLKVKPSLRTPPGPSLAFLVRNSIHLGLQPPEVLLGRWAAKFGVFPSPLGNLRTSLLRDRRRDVSISAGKEYRLFGQPRSCSRPSR